MGQSGRGPRREPPARAGGQGGRPGSPAARAAILALSGSGALVSEGGRARFADPAFGDALYRELAPGARVLLHRRAFAALAEAGEEAGAVAHAERAELAGDAEALELLERVGRSALAGGLSPPQPGRWRQP